MGHISYQKLYLSRAPCARGRKKKEERKIYLRLLRPTLAHATIGYNKMGYLSIHRTWPIRETERKIKDMKGSLKYDV